MTEKERRERIYEEYERRIKKEDAERQQVSLLGLFHTRVDNISDSLDMLKHHWYTYKKERIEINRKELERVVDSTLRNAQSLKDVIQEINKIEEVNK